MQILRGGSVDRYRCHGHHAAASPGRAVHLFPTIRSSVFMGALNRMWWCQKGESRPAICAGVPICKVSIKLFLPPWSLTVLKMVEVGQWGEGEGCWFGIFFACDSFTDLRRGLCPYRTAGGLPCSVLTQSLHNRLLKIPHCFISKTNCIYFLIEPLYGSSWCYLWTCITFLAPSLLDLN